MAQIHPDTETAVANEALSHIFEPGLVSIDSDVSRKADVVRLHFASTRDALQRRYPWNYNKTRAVLTDSLTRPLFDYSYQFVLPNAPRCLRVREVRGCRENEWSVEGNVLLTNRCGPINVIYSRLEPAVAKWDALFRNLFGYSLAACLGEIAQDQADVEHAAQKAADGLRQAFPVDAQESGEDDAPEADILAARR